MKQSWFVAAVSLIFSGSLMAEDPPGGADFDALDGNRDGMVSEAEFLQHHVAELKRAFAALDGNRDGSLQQAELGPPVQTASGPRFAIPRIIAVKPEASIHSSKVTAGTRGPAGPLSRRISR